MKRLFSIWFLFTLLTFGLKAQEIKLDTLVNLEFEGISLKQALHKIAQQYSIRFSYSDSKIQTDNIIHAIYSACTMGDMLRDMLHSHEINYSIIGNQIVLFPFQKNQQIAIHGKIIDEMTGLPIPFVHIAITGTSKGTSSNEEGEFEIGLTKLPTELLISHLSHEKKLIYVYSELEELEIKLMPSQIALPEITVNAKRNKISNYQLLKKAYDRLSKRDSELNYGKAFYRQKSKRDNNFTEIFELFYDVKYTNAGIKDWAVQEGRYAFQNDNKNGIFLYNKNFTLLSRLFPIKQPETESYLIPVNPHVKKLFDLELKDVIKFDQRFIGVISYKPKSIVSQPAARGELYIDIDNYQILKIKGTFSDASLEIIGFTDSQSNWDNYQLDFQISFIDTPSDQLLMDYIRINHSFDYYFKKEHIGKINTSSLLTFYEHYTPVKNKKLGGAINFKTSDMEVIDGIGYNATFWSQNPIVKRTPLEEQLIRDFEQNEAFGVVFLNNEEEVVLLPEIKYDEKAQRIITSLVSKYSENQAQRIFLRLDKNNYIQGDNVRFASYVVDSRTLKPNVLGSVLTIEVNDAKGEMALTKKFDINEGLVYGEFEITDIAVPGKYHLKAYTNVLNGQSFEKDIYISYQGLHSSISYLPLEDIKERELVVEIHPESGIILDGIKTKVVFSVKTSAGQPVKAKWQIVDDLGTILQTPETNQVGIGSFEITASEDNACFLQINQPESKFKWMIPKCESAGVSMKISGERTRSIQVELRQKPVMPKEIYLLSMAHGKVSNFYMKSLQGARTKVDIPTQRLSGGVNILVAMDQKGKILCQRKFYLDPNKLTIQLESASWKSKRSNRLQLKFKITDQNSKPVNANLSAVCSTIKQAACQHCDIRNYLYFQEDSALEYIDLTVENDSIFSLIDEILIASDGGISDNPQSAKSNNNIAELLPTLTKHDQLEEPVIVEVNISGNYTSSGVPSSNKSIKHHEKQETKNQEYWIPILEINPNGIATIDYRVSNKNEKLHVNIQGLSNNGLIGYQNFSIDPRLIKTTRNKEAGRKIMFNN